MSMSEKYSGFFITIEGNDGAGKTTAAKGLEQALKAQRIPVVLTREPGGSSIAEQIRQILLNPDNTDMDPLTEAILYAAARRQHLSDVVIPALQQGKVVLCDRYIDSSLAYQGEGRGLGIEKIAGLNEIAVEGLWPDLTLFLQVDLEAAKARMLSRGDLNRLDAESEAFHARVRTGFEKAVQRDPERFICIDASGTPDEVLNLCLEALKPSLEKVRHDQ